VQIGFSGLTACVTGLLLLASGTAFATSYVGFGGGLGSPQSSSAVTDVYLRDSDTWVVDSVGFDLGWLAEAQFGWEANAWMDFEGALRFHKFYRETGTVPDPKHPRVDGFSLVGFEGGLRLRTQRGFTNTVPYIRGGVGSYSPSVDYDNGQSVSNVTLIGYYVGVGYIQEINSKIGMDIRVTWINFDAFDRNRHSVELQANFVAIALSLIVF
jgi:hypothetical protein